MPNDPSAQALREFLRHLDASSDIRMEIEVSVERSEEPEEAEIRLTDGTSLEDQVGETVLLRVESSTDPTAWIAEASWTEDARLRVERVRRAGADAATLQHSRSSYRVAVPPSSMASLTRIDTGETVTVEPVDISRGGMGVRVEKGVSLGPGDRVEVDLNIVGEFSDTLSGTIAFAEEEKERGQIRAGVHFDELASSVADGLRSALNKILLGTTQELS